MIFILLSDFIVVLKRKELRYQQLKIKGNNKNKRSWIAFLLEPFRGTNDNC
jgi:hypothetical protein